MTNLSIADQLEQSIEILLAHPESKPVAASLAVRELLGIAAELRFLPSPEFKAQLKINLLQQAQNVVPAHPIVKAPVVEIRKPTLRVPDLPMFTIESPRYPLHGGRFAVSFLAHALAVTILFASGFLMKRKPDVIEHTTVSLVDPDLYALPPASDRAGGGGGGGDRDKLQASHGTPPHFASEQLTPPAVVVRNPAPKLAAEPTVVGPPTITFPQAQLGDPLSAIADFPSNGTGSGGGIGGGEGGGVGIGYGPGVGPGHGGGIGGGIFRVGGGVSAPRAVYAPDPEYSEEGRQAKYQGTVVLWVIIDAEGHPRDLRVARSLGLGLDEKAMDAVRKWRFEPAMKDGLPVAVEVNVEVSFRLY
jgi:protein TonB